MEVRSNVKKSRIMCCTSPTEDSVTFEVSRQIVHGGGKSKKWMQQHTSCLSRLCMWFAFYVRSNTPFLCCSRVGELFPANFSFVCFCTHSVFSKMAKYGIKQHPLWWEDQELPLPLSFQPPPDLEAPSPFWYQHATDTAWNSCETWDRVGLRQSTGTSWMDEDATHAEELVGRDHFWRKGSSRAVRRRVRWNIQTALAPASWTYTLC